MNISLTFYATGISTDNLRVVVYDTSAPTVEVAAQLFSPPHSTPRTIQFTGLEDVTHLVKIYQTPTSSGGTVRHDFMLEATGGAFEVRETEYLQESVTSGLTAGATQYVNTDWDGWEIEIERVGMGTMYPGTDYDVLAGGGFELLQSGDTFQALEKFVVKFLPRMAPVSVSTAFDGRLFAGTEVVTDFVDLDQSYQSKAIRLEGDWTQLVVTLPRLSTIFDKKMFYFLSEGGSHINAVLNCAGSDVIRWRGQALTKVILGQSEEIYLYKHDSEWRVFHADGNFKSVGELFFAATDEADLLNALECDGRELDRDEYPRLWDYVSNLPAGQLKNFATWETNKGYFSTGDGVNTFNIPDLRNRYLRAKSSTTVAGEYQENQNKSHTHAISTTNSGASSSNTADPVRGSIAGTPSAQRGAEDKGTISATGGSETRPETSVQKCFIKV